MSKAEIELLGSIPESKNTMEPLGHRLADLTLQQKIVLSPKCLDPARVVSRAGLFGSGSGRNLKNKSGLVRA